MKHWGEKDGNLKERNTKYKRRERKIKRFCLFTYLKYLISLFVQIVFQLLILVSLKYIILQ